jgi:hypothetical protein
MTSRIAPERRCFGVWYWGEIPIFAAVSVVFIVTFTVIVLDIASGDGSDLCP